MQTMNDIRHIYSVYSGSFFEIPEEDIKVLNTGQIPLKRKPSSSCKKCYGKGHIGKNVNNFTYQLCSCVIKNIDLDIVKSVMN